MKKAKLFCCGLLVCGLMLVGCATGTTTGGDQPDSTAADKLAADINAIKAESATVNGNTVKLTGDVATGKTTLIVPAGVTLDVTAYKLGLGFDVTLTVNGTVNANSGYLWLGDTGTQTTINGTGEIHLKSKGRLLQINDKKLVLDGVTLIGLKDNDNSLVEVGKGGELVMKSGTITDNTAIGEGWIEGGGVRVVEGGKFIMEGGAITGNRVPKKAGGVFIYNGTFTMKDGTISDNISGANAGGVWVSGGTFTMEGGTIYGNTCGEGNSNGASGGGVALNENGVFILKGGRIQGSTDSDGFTRNITADGSESAALAVWGIAKWGTGGTYTKGGVPQTGGSNIVGHTDDTLIATP